MTGDRPRTSPPRVRFRLKHKVAISLSVAALLPVAIAAWVAVSIVLRGLDAGLMDQTDRQLSIGLSLMLRNVQRFGQDAVRLSRVHSLGQAVAGGPAAVAEALRPEMVHLPSCLVQVADREGLIVAARAAGASPRLESLALPDKAPLFRDGLAYERKVTLGIQDHVLVMRAVAPVVDDTYSLLGALVVSAPLDGDFADGIKGALGAEVLLFAGEGPAQTTFIDPFGARLRDITVPPQVAAHVVRGRTVLDRRVLQGRGYSVGYTPIEDLDGAFVGVFGVAVDRAPVLAARAAAMRSLALGAAGAFAFALGLTALLSRRLAQPLARLHRGALAIARGDLGHRIDIRSGDEIGDLAEAFTQMTRALKENQQRLAARMRELVALHDAGRAVSSVLGIDELLRKIVDAAARVLDVRICTVWLVDGDQLRVGAGRARTDDTRATLHGQEVVVLAAPLEPVVRAVASARRTLRVDRVADDMQHRVAAVAAGITGSLIATPLERTGQVLGVILVGRTQSARPLNEAEANLLATFADQAAAAIENARLYEEVRQLNEELEAKVRLRTQELEASNTELERAVRELRDTQAQLILSERLAGLGQLVAGVAHEINSPSAAIRGTVDALAGTVAGFSDAAAQVARAPMSAEKRREFLAWVAERVPELARKPLTAPAAVRRESRDLAARLGDAQIPADVAAAAARTLADLGATDLAPALVGFCAGPELASLVAYLKHGTRLHRNADTIARAIHRIQRIVGALKSYSHLDQQATLVHADLHEGIENTLVMLQHELGHGIKVVRRYGQLPPVAMYVDELNQVWTNLIHNAVQATNGSGTIAIETEMNADRVAVRIIDDGPGVPPEAMARIFEPFFTTKPPGEGSGLGLGIVRHIVEKHGGTVTVCCENRQTCFEVILPVDGGTGIRPERSE
jgi:signal transduction histidine kinase